MLRNRAFSGYLAAQPSDWKQLEPWRQGAVAPFVVFFHVYSMLPIGGWGISFGIQIKVINLHWLWILLYNVQNFSDTLHFVARIFILIQVKVLLGGGRRTSVLAGQQLMRERSVLIAIFYP
jgi:hypothetical protein